MKIDIIGRHPTAQPGFCGVMALYEARHLARFGHDVKLIIPFHTRDQMMQRLAHVKGSSLDELLKPEDMFEIEALVLNDAPQLRKSDAVIWQSTDALDWDTLYPLAQKNSRVVTKNFPKLIRGRPAELSANAAAQIKAFDLIAFALKEDYQALWQYPEFARQNQHKFTYVPRGADPRALHTRAKTSTPVIAIDTPNTRDTVGIEHLFEPITRLKQTYPDLEVVSLGGAPLPFEFAQRLPFMPFNSMYQKFLNPAWLYCVVDYAQSPAHIKGAIHKDDRTWDAKAIYEVQTVEAQMAGAIIAGFKKNVIPELVEPKLSVLWDDFADADEITATMARAIEAQTQMSTDVRARAIHLFDWETSIKKWENGLLNLVENGYRRDKKTYGFSARWEGPREVATDARDDAASSVTAALNADEKTLLHALLTPCRRYVEFGCGGSTKIATLSGVNHIESIETDKAWIDSLAEDPVIVPQVDVGRVRFHHIDIGKTKEWGYPVVNDPVLSARYAKAPWRHFPLDDVDLVLVDGRFRVAAALEAALRTEHHCLIAVDDYLDRPHFGEIENHLDIAVKASRMVVFSKGEKWDRLKAFDALEAYRFDPR